MLKVYIIFYQVYYFEVIGKIDSEVTTSGSSARFERCIQIVFKVDVHSALVQKSFFDIVLWFHRNRYRLDMFTFGTQVADFEKDWHMSMLRITGRKGARLGRPLLRSGKFLSVRFLCTIAFFFVCTRNHARPVPGKVLVDNP